ncbi:MAG TPA: magnesium chelatase [Saprospiraceae bacterium]|nr:magnesium chelatase [Saprospiraceae bacterium]HPI08209.1 magnesium chelatase [Saprospiraceae bacterium]
MKVQTQLRTLGALKKSGYQPRSVKDELRANLISRIRNKEKVFPGIYGFDDTVLPDVERAILSRHNILLLGLRGQAKTRIARMLVNLLDEYIPVVAGSELNDDPLAPISRWAKDLIAEKGDDTPVDWLHRDERYVEKLATPDVSIADLVGDVDPIKAANLRLPYSDERVIHFGLIPRSHRCLFVINELPDLQARIQVSLFNVLQEGDMQIRGFKLRLPLDVEFVFTANPEDYTNRGSIITPLKDRIESQITTHYPNSIVIGRLITEQEARISKEQKEKIHVPEVLKNLLEEVAFAARDSEFVDKKSGVSARLSISAFENLYSTAERRMLLNGEEKTTARITDFWGIIPALTGKVEMVYEGEQEGPQVVAMNIIGAALKKMFLQYFPNPVKLKRGQERDPYGTLKAWFAAGNAVDLLTDADGKKFLSELDTVAGLRKIAENLKTEDGELYTFMELCLHGLAEFEVLNKEFMETRLVFKDYLSGNLKDDEGDDDDVRDLFN